MKAFNWLYNTVRHTRRNDRVFKEGTIDVHINGFTLNDKDNRHMDINLTESELREISLKINNLLCNKEITIENVVSYAHNGNDKIEETYDFIQGIKYAIEYLKNERKTKTT